MLRRCYLRSTFKPLIDKRSYTSFKTITNLPLDVDHTTTDHNYVQYLAENLEELGPYPTYSKYVNPLHFYQNTVMNQWSSKKAHPITLQHLANYGKKLTKEKILSSANFVRLELTIRIAKKLKDFQILPFAAISNHHLVRVYESYYNIFETFRKIRPITNLEENDKFCILLSRLLTDNLLSLPHLIMGNLECSIVESMSQKSIDEFMSSTLRARISRRLICEEHLSLTDKFKNNLKNIDIESDDYIGDIFYKCSPVENLKYCSDKIKQTYKELNFPNEGFLSPDLIIKGNTEIKFQFMVTHLRYLFGEILRNSYDSTIHNFIAINADKSKEFFTKNKPPPVVVTIIDSKTSISFKFSDQGGGVKGLSLDEIWSFGKNEVSARESLRNFHKLPGLQLAADYNPPNLNISAKKIESKILEPKKNLEIAQDSSSSNSLASTSLGGHYNDTKFINHKVPDSLQNLIERPSNFKLSLGLAMCKVYAEYWNGNITMNSLENYGTDTHLTLEKLGINKEPKLDKA